MRKLVHVLLILGLVTTFGCKSDEDPPAGNGGDGGAGGESGTSGEGGASGEAGASGEGGAGGESGTSGEGGAGGEAGTSGEGGNSGEGGTSGEGGAGGGNPVPLAQVPSEFAGAICAALDSCVGPSKLRELLGREECETRLQAELENGELAYIDDSITAGRVLYNPARLEECLEGIRGMGCAVVTDTYPDACVEVIAGNVPLDGECTISSECAGTAFCDGRMACPSTCKPLLAAGDTCASDDECGDDLLCLGGECMALAPEGEECGEAAGVICAIGYSCIGFTEDSPGTCTPNAEVQAGDVDDECTPNGTLCMEGLSCVPISGDPEEYRCREAVGAGETCRLAQPGQCPVDQYCVAEFFADGTCTALPTDGEACVLTQLICAPGFACVLEGQDPICRAIVANGEPCTGDGACRSGNCLEGQCAPPEVCD